MILYFADRHLNILGQATTHLPKGVRVTDDLKTEDVETGVAIFECDIHFDSKTMAKVKEWAKVGNYILRSSDNEFEFYNIIDSKKDTKKQKVYIYAEDDGLDLLNDVVGAYEADEYYPVSYYVERFAGGAGWEIGINEAEGLTRKLSWNSAQTASARLLSIAEAFNNCELSYSFEIKGLKISKKYINIYEKRGKDTGVQLRLNKEIDSIITTESIANLATALRATGGTPDNSEEPITLLGYEYDDGNFYVDGEVLKSRKALEKWSRYLWKDDETQQSGGHITKEYTYDTTSQAVLCEKTIAELKKVCDMEVNYEADISKFPDNVKIGDRVNIIDDKDELYLSSRVLILETSASEQTRKAVLGEHLIRKNGISTKVSKLASEFAKMTISVSRAKAIAENAKGLAEDAAAQATEALNEASAALGVANEAQGVANNATQSAASAEALAQAAQAAVDKVEESVDSLETTVTEAKNAANNAHQAANTATQKAEEAETAASNAVKDATEAKNAAGTAQDSAESAISKANEAIGTANTAKNEAQEASDIAAAAKLDAEQAEKDVAAFGENLETFKQTVSADYTRKTELTETKASLQAQITANANQLTITHNKVVEVDETANNAADLAAQAQSDAAAAQSQADQATADATKAQTAANEAKAAAQSAQSEADTAKAAAEAAQSVADKAKTDLEAATADLATVQGRVDATEEEIAAAQQAVTAAQQAADKAQEDADTAAQKASNAQSVANTAAENATNAQTVANNAATQASNAQQLANEAKGNAEQAQTIANQAAAKATEAQNTANTAKTNAENAQAVANQAQSDAAAAQRAADDAEAKAQQAQTDLATAQQNLADVTSRVDATAEEVAAAQAAVETAQAAADLAKSNAATAQSTADTAKANAAAAQTAANNAKTAADTAQAAADEAQAAADKAQADVNALTKRVTTAETSITKNSEEIALRAKKTEVTEAINNVNIGGRNLLINTGGGDSIRIAGGEMACSSVTSWTNDGILTLNCSTAGAEVYYRFMSPSNSTDELYGLTPGKEYTLSGKAFVTTESGTLERLCVRTQAYFSGGWSGGKTDVVVTGDNEEWKDFSTTFKVEDNASGYYVSLQLYYNGSWVGIIELKELKLEKGNKATDWTPAPEDMATKTEVTEAEANFEVRAEGIVAQVEAVQKSTEDNTTETARAHSLIEQLNKSVVMLVEDENGQTKMTQDSSGWEFDFATLEDTVKSYSTKIDQYGDYVNIKKYNGNPCIELGKTSNDNKVLITNEDIRFQVGSKTPTYISDDILVAEKIEVEDELNQNGWVWKKRSNGNFGLSWKGG